MCCDPCRMRKGSWWLRAQVDRDVFRVQHSTLASTCARREVGSGSIQSAGRAEARMTDKLIWVKLGCIIRIVYHI